VDIIQAYEDAVNKADDAIRALDLLRRSVEDIPDITTERAEDLNDIRALLSRQRVRLERISAFTRNRIENK